MLVGEAIERGENWKFLEFEAIFCRRGDPFEKLVQKLLLMLIKKSFAMFHFPEHFKVT